MSFEHRSRLLVTDADNTLWETDTIFAQAQLGLLEMVEKSVGRKTTAENRLRFVRDVDEELALRHPLHLRYPPRYLAAAVRRALSSDESASDAAESALRDKQFVGDVTVVEAEAVFVAQVARPPALRPGVLAGITGAQELRFATVVATESSAERCERILQHHNLSSLFLRVFSGGKSVGFYRDIAGAVGASRGALKFMVGDQIDRDVEWSQEAGYKAVLVPGTFQPRWVGTVRAKPDYFLERFDDLPALLRGIVE